MIQPVQPVRLTIIAPATGDPIETDFDHPGGYVVHLNLPTLGSTVLHRDAAAVVARALEGDGFSPYIDFALVDPTGRTIHLGPVNADMQRRQQSEQALREAITGRRA